MTKQLYGTHITLHHPPTQTVDAGNSKRFKDLAARVNIWQIFKVWLRTQQMRRKQRKNTSLTKVEGKWFHRIYQTQPTIQRVSYYSSIMNINVQLPELICQSVRKPTLWVRDTIPHLIFIQEK